MSMEDISIPADSDLWRSVISDSDNLNESANSTLFFDLPECDQLTPYMYQTGNEAQNGHLAEDLIDALRKLQLESAETVQNQESFVPVPVIDDPVLVNIPDQPSSIPEIDYCNQVIERIEKESSEPEENAGVCQIEDEKSGSTNESRVEKHIQEKLVFKEKNEEAAEKINCVEEMKCPKTEPEEDAEICQAEIEKSESPKKSEEVEEHTQEELHCEKKNEEVTEKINNVEEIKCPKIAGKCENLEPQLIANMKKAMKPFLQLSTKESLSKPASQKIQSTSRNRFTSKITCSLPEKSQSASQIKVPKRQFSNTSSTSCKPRIELKRQVSNLPNTLNKNNVTTLKRELSSVQHTSTSKNTTVKKNHNKMNNIVPIITSTKDGIKMKEEKINNFSIPVVNRKKRTQVIPFSFSLREKSSQPKVPTACTNKKTNDTSSKLVMKNKFTKNSPSIEKSINKENKLPKMNSMNLTSGKSKLISIAPTYQNSGLRQSFHGKVKQSQLEIKKMTTQVGQKKAKEEKIGSKITNTKVLSTVKAPLAPVRLNRNI